MAGGIEDIHVTSRIRTHDPSVRAGQDSSCFRPHDHCDRHNWYSKYKKKLEY
jgi:hypothetical protein